MHISGSIHPIVLIYACFERTRPTLPDDYQKHLLVRKLMTSQVLQGAWSMTAGYGRFRSQWVNQWDYFTDTAVHINVMFRSLH